ncbi:MAG TPA: hypothetical protein VF316_07650, partial [Polyangiaceae bacterium]
MMDLSLVSTGKTAWLGYSGSRTFLSTYEAGAWTFAPIAIATTPRYPSLASTSNGVWVAWADIGAKQSGLHVARRSGSAWVP